MTNSPRILYQSFGPESNRGYVDALGSSAAVAGRLFGATVEVRGITSALLAEKQHRAFHLAAGADLLDSVYRAENEGFSAAVIGNIQDPALYECRQVCRMPVVGMLESLLSATRPFATRLTLISSSARVQPLIRERALLYGEEHRLLSFDTIELPLPRIARAFVDPAAARQCAELFSTAARRAAAGGAEMVAPASGILATLLSVVHGDAAGWDLGVGVPVANPMWMAIGAAILAARATEAGLAVSRVGTYESPAAGALEGYFKARASRHPPD